MACTPIAAQITPVDATPTRGPWSFEYPIGHAPYYLKASFPDIWLPPDSGCYDITFKIGGSNSLVFNSTNPILINGSPPITSGGQIQPPLTLPPNSKQMTVTDLNSNNAADGPLSLTYTLNFTGMDSTHRTLDPVIKNGGKSTRTAPPPRFAGASLVDVGLIVINFAILITLLYVAYQVVMIRRKP